MPHQCTNCGRTFGDGSKEMLAGCPDCGGNKFQFHPAGTEPTPAEPPERPDPAELPGGAATATAVEHGSKAARAVERASTTLKDFVGRSSASSAAGEASDGPDGPEDFAQSSARSDMVEPGELPAASGPTAGEDGPPTSADTRAESGTRPELQGSGPWPGQEGPDATPEQSGAEPKAAPDEPTADPTTGEPDTTDDVDAEAETKPAGTPGEMSLQELRAELDDQFESIKIVEPGQYELNLMELYEREEYIVSLQEDGRYVIEMASAWGGD